MGLTYLDALIQNPAMPDKSTKGHFLVDSGAVYSVAPSSVLKKLGIKPSHKQKFSLANGEVIEKEVGSAFFKYNKKIGASPVVFGGEGVYLFGAVTLEALGMILDPINRELKPLPMLL